MKRKNKTIQFETMKLLVSLIIKKSGVSKSGISILAGNLWQKGNGICHSWQNGNDMKIRIFMKTFVF